MTLAAGTRLGPYVIEAPLGAGGMGEVYRARDSKLHRDVALKVLPDLFAADPDRLARFEREAQLLASLNHPHIAHIHGFEEASGVRALVLEYVDGETLGERIKRAPIALQESLTIARQIAEALEAAHERGIVHRDLKPANIKLTAAGDVKVLDFGLAKALEPAAETIASTAMTNAGMILGTAASMPPEQACGRPVDKRADIWAFGCVLFEMLARRQAFDGANVSDLIAAVLTRDPDWNLLPATVPPGVHQLLVRCLDRDSRRRLRDIGEAWLILDDPSAARGGSARATASTMEVGKPAWRRVVPWGLSALMAVIAGAAMWDARRDVPTASPLTTRFAIPLSADATLAFDDLGDIPAIALSPDGSRLVFVARRAGTPQLFLRDLNRMDARPIPGTDFARGPFFSPDGQWVGFFNGDELRKVSLSGGAPQSICTAPPVVRGASWGPDDTIIFTPQQATGLVRVSATNADGEAASAQNPSGLRVDGLPALTQPDTSRGERAHLWPEILPGGKAVLFTIATGENFDDALIAVQSLESGERRIVVKGGSNARYAPSGHLIYARGAALLAVPFDLSRLETTAAPTTVVEGVRVDARSGAGQFTLSSSGSLAYVSGARTNQDRTLVWVDRSGAATAVTETRRPYSYLSLSPDGRRLAFTMQGANQDVWIHALDRGVQTRLTFGPAENWGGIWTPDGRRVVFSRHGPHMPNLFWTAADGSGTPERLTTSERAQFAGSVSPDGKVLAFTDQGDRHTDIWLLPLEGTREARLHIGTPYEEYAPAFSPDGRWLAFVSTESGRAEIYVQPYPGPGPKRQISTAGGVAPVWGRGSREIFYRIGDQLAVVTFSSADSFTPALPRMLLKGQFEEQGLAHWPRNYDVAPGGNRFVMVKARDEVAARQIDVVLHFADELKRLYRSTSKNGGLRTATHLESRAWRSLRARAVALRSRRPDRLRRHRRRVPRHRHEPEASGRHQVLPASLAGDADRLAQVALDAAQQTRPDAAHRGVGPTCRGGGREWAHCEGHSAFVEDRSTETCRVPRSVSAVCQGVCLSDHQD